MQGILLALADQRLTTNGQASTDTLYAPLLSRGSCCPGVPGISCFQPIPMHFPMSSVPYLQRLRKGSSHQETRIIAWIPVVHRRRQPLLLEIGDCHAPF